VVERGRSGGDVPVSVTHGESGSPMGLVAPDLMLMDTGRDGPGHTSGCVAATAVDDHLVDRDRAGDGCDDRDRVAGRDKVGPGGTDRQQAVAFAGGAGGRYRAMGGVGVRLTGQASGAAGDPPRLGQQFRFGAGLGRQGVQPVAQGGMRARVSQPDPAVCRPSAGVSGLD
jgi:hypothetical protein